MGPSTRRGAGCLTKVTVLVATTAWHRGVEMQESTQSGELRAMPDQPHEAKRVTSIRRRSPRDAPSAPMVRIPKYVPMNSHVRGTIAFALLYGKH